MHRSRSSWILSALVLAGCSAEGPQITVMVTGVPAEATALRVRSAVDGNTAKDGDRAYKSITGDLTKFGIQLPTGKTGKLSVTVEAVWPDTCAHAQGQSQLIIDSGSAAMTIALAPLTVGACEAWPTKNLNSVWGSGAKDIWAVGDGGTILHYDGTSWSPFQYVMQNDLRGVTGKNANDAWAAGVGGVTLHWDGSAWVYKGSAGFDLNGISTGTEQSATPVAATQQGIYRWGGDSWSLDPTSPNIPFNNINQQFTGDKDGDAVGPSGVYYHHDSGAKSWKAYGAGQIPSNRTLFGVAYAAYHANSQGLHLVVGQKGLINLHDEIGPKVTDQSVGGVLADLRSVWTQPSIEPIKFGWITGDQGTILHWQGSMWSPVQSGISANLRSVWGTSDTDVWVVGDSGTILHWDGAAVSPWPSR